VLVGYVVVVSAADVLNPSGVASAAELAAAAEELAGSLDATVTSPTSFKQSEEEVQHKGFIIALIANTVAEAEGDAKWKSNALAVRDAALSLAKAKSQPNAEKAHKELKASFGGGSSGAGQVMKPLDVLSLDHVMVEVNNRNRTLTKNTRSTTFSRNKEAVARDAIMLALLAAAARQDTHSAQEAKKSQAEFEKFADQMINHAKELAAAAKKGDASAASTSYKAVKKACTECHAVFRPDIE
jgi:cytochrome c556